MENNWVTKNDMKNFDHQHITNVIEEVGNSCAEFNATDETELINLMPDNAKEISSTSLLETKLEISKNTLLTEHQHEFVNHLVKSPTLRLSPIPISTQVIYDNAVQELHMKQLQQLKLIDTSNDEKSCDNQTHNDENEKLEKVSVRKQLQQYEDLHRQFAKEIEKEEQLQKKREIAKQKALKQNICKKNDNIKSDKNNSENESSCKTNEIQQTEDEEEYIKVPVKDLITNFEQQCLQTPPPAPPLSNEKNNLERELAANIENAENLNKDLYMPKEIPLQSYAPPPVPTAVSSPLPPFATSYETNYSNTYKPLSTSPQPYSAPEPTSAISKPYGSSSNFPVSKPYQQGFSSNYGSNQPPKQQYLPPQSYQKIPQNTSQNVPQVNFNPSPLPYDKLAKFENPPADEGRYINSPPSRASRLNVRGSKVRNTSPSPFGGSYNRPYTPSSDSYHYAGSPSHSPRPLSSMQQYSGHNTPNLTHPTVTSNQILNAPSYNSSARGWGSNSGTSSSYQPQSYMSAPKPQLVNTGSMHYTDF